MVENATLATEYQQRRLAKNKSRQEWMREIERIGVKVEKEEAVKIGGFFKRVRGRETDNTFEIKWVAGPRKAVTERRHDWGSIRQSVGLGGEAAAMRVRIHRKLSI